MTKKKQHTSKNVYDFCVAIDEAVHSVELRLSKLEGERGREEKHREQEAAPFFELCAENLGLRNAIAGYQRNLGEMQRSLSNERAETLRLRNIIAGQKP